MMIASLLLCFYSATGVRLAVTVANRLHHENGQFGLLAACAAGGTVSVTKSPQLLLLLLFNYILTNFILIL